MNIKQYKIIVLKIGTTSITQGRPSASGISTGLNFRVINELALATVELRELGYQVIIVSSGAMGLGVAKLGYEKLSNQITSLTGTPDFTSFKQALTAVGQIELMNAYENVFKFYDLHAGQVLIAHAAKDAEDHNKTVKGTLEKLLALGVIPVINANDTVSSSEIEFGDNDSLSARIATIVNAERLVIISDACGLYDSDPRVNPQAQLIKRVAQIDSSTHALAGGSSSGAGLGGMKSKITAAEICLNQGTAVDIIGVKDIAQIPALVNNPELEINGTRFGT